MFGQLKVSSKVAVPTCKTSGMLRGARKMGSNPGHVRVANEAFIGVSVFPYLKMSKNSGGDDCILA